MKISQHAINNYQFTIIFILLLVLSGTVSFVTMPRSEDPQVTPKGTTVIIVYPGANPEDMEELITDPVEEKLNELDNIKRIESTCGNSIALTEVRFEADIDMDETYSEIVQKINSIRSDLPEEISRLDILKWNMSDFVIIFQAALVSETASFHALDQEADRLKKMLEKVGGIKKVKKWAIPNREVRISLDLGKMSQRRLALNQVMNAVQAGNFNIPGGDIDIGGRRFNIQTSGSYSSIDEIRNIVVNAFGEKIVRLGDIADIRFQDEDNLYLARTNGRRSVFVTVNQKDGSNIFDAMEGIFTNMEEFQRKLPASISLETVFDQSKSVADRMNKFFSNMLQGLILVGLVIFLTIGMRASFIVILAIPISILTAVGFIDLSGYGLQQMAIAGLVISLGLLVDNAIVVVENISRFIRDGASRIEAAFNGTAQIGWAIVSSTATTVLAFLPIAMMKEETGQFIRSMPMTVIFALTASLLIALTLTPFLASRLLRKKHKQKMTPLRRLLDIVIARAYRPTLGYALRHPFLVLILTIMLFAGSLTLFRFVGVSFFPKAEKPQLIINIKTPEGSSLSTTNRAVLYVESVLANNEDITCFASNIGHGNPKIHYNVESHEQNVSYAQIFIEFKHNHQERILSHIDAMRKAFQSYPGAQIEVKEIEQGPHVEAPVAIKILGENLDILRAVAADVEAVFLNTAGTVNVENPHRTSKTDLEVKINRAKAGMLGIPLVEIDRTIRAAISGLPVTKYRDPDGKEYDLVFRLPMKEGPRPEDFERIYVSSISGEKVPLSQIANWSFASSAKQIDHFQFDRTITVTADVETGYSVDRVTRNILEELEHYAWPKGYSYYVSGQQESREESFGGMEKAIIIALIAIFAVLVLQFRSFSQPLIVFTAIPLALIGSILALLISGFTFSFTAFIGLTSLVGIVVNNSIILVDYANQLRRSGKSITNALQEAGETRLVPIVLTSATTIGGLLPLTLRGGTLWGPMGWTIIGGLTVSTFLTPLVVPVLYKIYTPKNHVRQS